MGQLAKALKKAGFVVFRIKGSHHFMKHPDGRCSVVFVHLGEIIGPGLLLKILRDCEWSKEELESFL